MVIGADGPSSKVGIDLVVCDHMSATNFINMPCSANDYTSEDSASVCLARLRNC